jgi:pilus assembly protein Flp/PilA
MRILQNVISVFFMTTFFGVDMNKLLIGMNEFINDEAGVTAIEYALIAALIAIVIIGGATQLGQTINNKFKYIANCVNGTCA